jgi:endo-1,4-beta-xylanase
MEKSFERPSPPFIHQSLLAIDHHRRDIANMVSFSSLIFGLSAIAVSVAAPTEPVLDKRGPYNFALGPDHPFARRSNVTRRSNTNYNQDYTTGGTVSYSPGTNEFSVSWNTQDDFVVGVGWNPGSNL